MKQKLKNLINLLEQIEQQFTGLTDARIDIPSQEFLTKCVTMRIKLERLLKELNQ